VIRGVDGRDRELAKYVVDKKCLGILSEDSDFFVFEGVPHVFSPGSMKFRNMTTVEYRREIFLQSTRLESTAFPILATLMGNDFISKGQVRIPLADLFVISYQRTTSLNPRVLFPGHSFFSHPVDCEYT